MRCKCGHEMEVVETYPYEGTEKKVTVWKCPHCKTRKREFPESKQVKLS